MRFLYRSLSILSLSIFLFVLGCMGPGSQHLNAGASGDLQTSQKFTLKDIRDNTVSLEAVLKQNKAVLLNFWATWCPPCREEIPALIKLQETYKNKSFTVLGVDVGESQRKVAGFAEKARINYPLALDSDMKAAEAFQVFGIPTTYLITSDGKILGEYHGFTEKLVQDVSKVLK